MEDPENQVLDIIELVLTAHIYNDFDQLDENDLPPRIRKSYWNSKERRVDRPIIVSENAVDRIYEIPHAWRLIKTLPFVVFEEFGARINLTGTRPGCQVVCHARLTISHQPKSCLGFLLLKK